MTINPMYLAALQGEPVRIEWLDSQGDDAWHKKADYVPKHLFPISSWGILSSYDEEKIVLAAHDSELWWGNVSLIPIVSILDIRQVYTKATIIQSAKPEGGQGDEKKTAPPRKGS